MTSMNASRIPFAGHYKIHPAVAHQRNIRGQDGDAHLAEVYRTLGETDLGERIRKLSDDLTLHYDVLTRKCGHPQCQPTDCPTGKFEVEHPIVDRIAIIKARGFSRSESRLTREPWQSVREFLEKAVSREER